MYGHIVSGAKIGRSVPKLLDRVNTLLPILRDATVAPSLAAWGFDAARVAEGETFAGALRTVDRQQELALKALPPATRAYYLAKGNLYLDCKCVARRGRRRFARDAARAAAYALDLLDRARGRSAKPAAAAPAAPTGA